MPADIYRRSFRVRTYECDAFGIVNNTVYLQYILEASREAGVQAGIGPDDWPACETEIEYLRSLHYGDTVEVATWLAAAQGNTVRRAFEFRLPGSDDLIARAHSDVVLDHGPAGQPLPLPTALFAGLPPLAPIPFPEPPPPPVGTFRLRRRVPLRDVDLTGRLNEAAYLIYMDECGMGVLEAFGWSPARMIEAGFALILRRHHLQYLAPAQPGDEIETATWAFDVKRATATRHYCMTRTGDDACLLRAHSLAVWVDLASGRPMRIPAAFLADFAPNLVF